MAPIFAAALLALALAAEPGGAGDIPDTQAFVTFAGPGYSVLVPEGWSRTSHGAVVTFRSNANAEAVAPVAGPNADAVLRARFGAQSPIARRRVTLGGRPVTVASFVSTGAADAVTGKRLRLANQGYAFERDGRRMLLVLSAPAGADNADQWAKIAGSFRWR